MKSEKKHRTVHTHEFKVEAVKLTLQGDRSVQEVADNLGIHISFSLLCLQPTLVLTLFAVTIKSAEIPRTGGDPSADSLPQ